MLPPKTRTHVLHRIRHEITRKVACHEPPIGSGLQKTRHPEHHGEKIAVETEPVPRACRRRRRRFCRGCSRLRFQWFLLRVCTVEETWQAVAAGEGGPYYGDPGLFMAAATQSCLLTGASLLSSARNCIDIFITAPVLLLLLAVTYSLFSLEPTNASNPFVPFLSR